MTDMAVELPGMAKPLALLELAGGQGQDATSG
jgi:hypothetical protein